MTPEEDEEFDRKERENARLALRRAGLNDDFEQQTCGALDKASNPKDVIGSDKLPLHLWPTTATAMGCIGLLEGAVKYGRLNWRHTGVRASIYVDACKRHLDAWMEGENVAPDSGVPHLANALACLAIIVDAQAAGKLTDDRSYNGAGYRKLVEELTPHVPRLKKAHADRKVHHYTIADNVAQKTAGQVMGGFQQEKFKDAKPGQIVRVTAEELNRQSFGGEVIPLKPPHSR